MASSSRLELPLPIVEKLIEGKELGDVMRDFNQREVRYSTGAVGVFSRGYVDRSASMYQSLHLSFSRFLSPQALWKCDDTKKGAPITSK